MTAGRGERGIQRQIRLFTASHKGLAESVPRLRERMILAPPDKGGNATPGFPTIGHTAGSPMSSATGSGKTPARVTFSYLTPNNLGVVRKLNSVLFPVKYAEKYYKDILAPEVEDFCQLGERAPP